MIQAQTPIITMVHISTVNITGLRNILFGLSLMKDCFNASFTNAGSKSFTGVFKFFDINYFYLIPKYSAIGPSDKAGKNESAAIIKITANTMMPNVPVSVFNVPALSGVYFFLARIPAIATGPII